MNWTWKQSLITVIILAAISGGISLWLEGWHLVEIPVLNSDQLKAKFDRTSRVCLPAENGPNRGWGECGSIKDMSLDLVSLHNTSMMGAALSSSQFNSFVFSQLDLGFSRWNDVQFISGQMAVIGAFQSNFENVTFEDTDITGARFLGAKFTNCIFKNVRLTDVFFNNASFDKVRFEKVTCYNCDFRGAVFSDSHLDGDFEFTYYNERTLLPLAWDELKAKGFSFKL